MNKNFLYLFVLVLLILGVLIYYFLIPTNESKIISNNKIMNTNNLSSAYFSWWCFWCMEWIFEAQEWVKEAVVWYIGWTSETANYEDVSTWNTQHRESVKVIYDPDIISYDTLIWLYWRQIDPTDPNWQFADKWFQYTTAIYYSDDIEKNIAESNKDKLDNSWKFDKPIVTKILPYSKFYLAEEYHQNYYKKSATRYKLYKKLSGREWYIEKNWKNDDKNDLKSRLTPLQYKVTQENGTERPYDNKYWDNKAEWIYVDIVDWTPLYSSLDKYESNTGWPSFTKPIDDWAVIEKEDDTLFSKRTEIRWAQSNSHLWHVFPDGPINKWWLRYCMNSAALKFIPVDELEEKGYWEYLDLFNEHQKN